MSHDDQTEPDGLISKDEYRPCEFYDNQTLEYFIKTDRDQLKESAKKEWRKRWGTDYPLKGNI